MPVNDDFAIFRRQRVDRFLYGKPLLFPDQGQFRVIVVGDGPGFYTSRILAPYMAEALEMLDEGLAIDAIDKSATDFGMPMGPVELADSVGLDVALHVARMLSPVIGRPVSPRLEAMVEAEPISMAYPKSSSTLSKVLPSIRQLTYSWVQIPSRPVFRNVLLRMSIWARARSV